LIVWIVVVPCVAVIGVALSLARRYFIVVHVAGISMAPTLIDGDRLLVRRRTAAGIAPGTLIVLAGSGGPGRVALGTPKTVGAVTKSHWRVKRVAAVAGQPVPESVRPAVDGAVVVPPGMVVVLSDNPLGIDSRACGFQPTRDVLGTVVRRLPSQARESRPATSER
jgi:signal peptidase I